MYACITESLYYTPEIQHCKSTIPQSKEINIEIFFFFKEMYVCWLGLKIHANELEIN